MWHIVVLLIIQVVHSIKFGGTTEGAPLGYFLLEEDKNYNLTWQDQGCEEPTTVSLYRANNIDGYFVIGDYVQPNYNPVGTFDRWEIPYGPAIAVREVQVGNSQLQQILLPVSKVVKIWDSTNYVAKSNVTIWRPLSPHPDYIVLGDVASEGIGNLPNLDLIRAVHKSCVTTCQRGELLWSSYSNKGYQNADIYGIRSDDGLGITGTFFTEVTTKDESQLKNDKPSSSINTYPCLYSKCLSRNAPQQVHISTGSDIGTYRINWVTIDKTNVSMIRYGMIDNDMKMSKYGNSYVFTDPGLMKRKISLHQVVLNGLRPHTTYYYQVGDPNHGWSYKYSFTTITNDPIQPVRIGVYGDLGYRNSRSIDLLKKEVLIDKSFNMIIHVGDFAYDMDDNNGIRGDNFFRMIEPISSSVPYQVCPGNHESAYNFTHYINRFNNMPFIDSGSTSNFYYSWDYSFAHFVAFSTEVYFTDGPDWGLIQSQYNWLENDLAKANKNRNQRPWLIVFGHRPMYCSDDSIYMNYDGSLGEYTDCTKDASTLRNGPNGKFGIEQLFMKYGVDLYLTAHEHSYERMYPVYNNKVYGTSYVNPRAPVHIVSGAAGCQENLDGFGPPLGPWSAFRSASYGYGRLHIYNSTFLHWEQIDDSNGLILDEFMLIQNKHGPF